MSKIFQISHNDLDGIGAVVVGKIIAEQGGYTHDYKCVAIGKQDMLIRGVLRNPEIDSILITDLGISAETAALIDKSDKKVWWVDHHQTSLAVAEGRAWANVQTNLSDNSPILVSATWLLTKGFATDLGVVLSKAAQEFAWIVSRYDTWEWKKHPLRMDEEDLNILFRYLGIPQSVDHYTKLIDTLGDRPFALNFADTKIVETIKQIRANNIESAKKDARYISFSVKGETYKVSCVPVSAEYGTAEMTAIYEDSRFNSDFVVGLYVTTKSLSFRASPNSAINLGLIAKAMGGGGHPSAAGVKLSSDEFLEVLRRYYDSTEYLIPRE